MPVARSLMITRPVLSLGRAMALFTEPVPQLLAKSLSMPCLLVVTRSTVARCPRPLTLMGKKFGAVRLGLFPLGVSAQKRPRQE